MWTFKIKAQIIGERKKNHRGEQSKFTFLNFKFYDNHEAKPQENQRYTAGSLPEYSFPNNEQHLLKNSALTMISN